MHSEPGDDENMMSCPEGLQISWEVSKVTGPGLYRNTKKDKLSLKKKKLHIRIKTKG